MIAGRAHDRGAVWDGQSRRSWRGAVSARGEGGDAVEPAARAVRALVDVEVGDAQPEGLEGFGRGGDRLGSRRVQGDAGPGELVTLVAIAVKPVVADAHEARGQHVDRKSVV